MRWMSYPPRTESKQRGATLIVTLIFLLIIVTLSVASLQTSELELRMAGNFQNSNIAFQSAESALRDAETYLESITGLEGFDNTCSKGLCASGSAFAEDILAPANGFEKNAINYGDKTKAVKLSGIRTQPKYLIEGIRNKLNDEILYRITAIATGGDANSEVILTSTYKK